MFELDTNSPLKNASEPSPKVHKTKTCCHCQKEIQFHGHYNHELACGAKKSKPLSKKYVEKSDKKPSREATKMSTCSYCCAEIPFKNHFKHEQECSKVHGEKSKSRKSVGGRPCKYCKVTFGKSVKGHEEKCAKFHKYIKNGRECVFCEKSTAAIFAHLQKEHLDLIEQDNQSKAKLIQCNNCDQTFSNQGNR